MYIIYNIKKRYFLYVQDVEGCNPLSLAAAAAAKMLKGCARTVSFIHKEYCVTYSRAADRLFQVFAGQPAFLHEKHGIRSVRITRAAHRLAQNKSSRKRNWIQ